MDISYKYIRELGYNKINRYYFDIIKNKKVFTKDRYTNEKLSMFTLASKWGATFGVVQLNILTKFTVWYKLYYPLVGLQDSNSEKTKVLKASQRLRMDYLEATGVDIGDLAVLAPKLEVDSILENTHLSEENIKICEFINSIYAWHIICYNMQKNISREEFERVIYLLTEDSNIFLKRIKE